MAKRSRDASARGHSYVANSIVSSATFGLSNAVVRGALTDGCCWAALGGRPGGDRLYETLTPTAGFLAPS